MKSKPETISERITRKVTELENGSSDQLWYSDDIIGCLEGISTSLKIVAEDISEYNRDQIDSIVEYFKGKNKSISKESLYRYVLWAVGSEIHESLYETEDYLVQIYAKRKLFFSNTEASEALRIIVEISSILKHALEKGYEAADTYDNSPGYLFYLYRERYDEIYGKDTTEGEEDQEEVRLREFEDACEKIQPFITHIEEYRVVPRLYELANKLQVFCILLGGSGKESHVGAINRDVATLMQFMQECCEKQKLRLLKHRRRALNDSHGRGTITLPKHVGKWTSGQPKKYKVDDLTKNWPHYREVLLNLPELKQ